MKAEIIDATNYELFSWEVYENSIFGDFSIKIDDKKENKRMIYSFRNPYRHTKRHVSFRR